MLMFIAYAFIVLTGILTYYVLAKVQRWARIELIFREMDRRRERRKDFTNAEGWEEFVRRNPPIEWEDAVRYYDDLSKEGFSFDLILEHLKRS